MNLLLQTINQNSNESILYKLKPYKKSSDFVRSPLRYPGGKFYGLKNIIPFLDCIEHDEFREPFFGGGNIFFAKHKAKHNWINDLDRDIINFYEYIACPKKRKDLIQKFENEIASREKHASIKVFKPSNLFEEAYKTYYLNRTSYSGIIHKPAWGYKDGKSSPPKNWSKFLTEAGPKLEKIKITNLDFEEVIKAKSGNNKVLLYLDPPYFHADQKRAYQKSFTPEEHIRLRNVLKETKYSFCLSYDDCAEIREFYDWAYIYETSWLYCTDNSKGGKRKTGNELLITNYKIEFPLQKCLLELT